MNIHGQNQNTLHFCTFNVLSEYYTDQFNEKAPPDFKVNTQFLNITPKAQSIVNELLKLPKGLPEIMALQECTSDMATELTSTLNNWRDVANIAAGSRYKCIHACHKISNQDNLKNGVAIIALVPEKTQVEIRTQYVDAEVGKRRATLLVQLPYNNRTVRIASFHITGHPNATIGDTQLLNVLRWIKNPSSKTPLPQADCILFGTDLNQTPTEGVRVQMMKGFNIETNGYVTEPSKARRIDFIGHKVITTTTICRKEDANTLDAVLTPMPASDHLPVVRSLIIGEAAGAALSSDIKTFASVQQQWQPPVQPPIQAPAPAAPQPTSSSGCSMLTKTLFVALIAFGLGMRLASR
ncbi:MAG: endonuclease/exonuclease/phosphatase family protein [Chlamydiales bacterium]